MSTASSGPRRSYRGRILVLASGSSVTELAEPFAMSQQRSRALKVLEPRRLVLAAGGAAARSPRGQAAGEATSAGPTGLWKETPALDALLDELKTKPQTPRDDDENRRILKLTTRGADLVMTAFGRSARWFPPTRGRTVRRCWDRRLSMPGARWTSGGRTSATCGSRSVTEPRWDGALPEIRLPSRSSTPKVR